jgi:7-dehydrocholesterol reductase
VKRGAAGLFELRNPLATASTMWGNSKNASVGLLGSGFFRNAIGPFLVGSFTTLFIPIIVMANLEHDGSLWSSGSLMLKDPLGFYGAWFTLPSKAAVQILLAWSLFQLALMKLVPGRTFRGPVTPAGNVPVYTANGFQCFVITVLSYLVAVHYFHLFNPSIVVDNFKDLVAGLNIFALGFCGFLLLKGLWFPSSTDCGSNGNVVMDYYWGTELYPRILGWDVKLFTNCRFGMMAWAVLPLVFAAKQQEQYGQVSPALMTNIALQLIYCCKVRRRRERRIARGGCGLWYCRRRKDEASAGMSSSRRLTALR